MQETRCEQPETAGLFAHIVKRRRPFTVDVRFEVPPGAAVAIFGASGAGKSTVLDCLAGYETPDAGALRLNGKTWFDDAHAAAQVPPHRRRVGLLTQRPALFPHLSVAKNVLFGLSAAEQREPAVLRWVETLTARLELRPFWGAMPGAISGGQARRVALARTLARRPALLLLDEPFNGLDRPLVRRLLGDLLAWRAELGFSLIAVDHGPEVLRQLCPERVLVLEAGHVLQEGSWEELYQCPATEALRAQLAPL